MVGKTNGRSVTSTSFRLLKSSAKFKGNAIVKRAVWEDLDVSTFQIKFSPSLQHRRCCINSVDRVSTKRKSENKLRRVSWESGSGQHQTEPTNKPEHQPASYDTSFMDTGSLVQTLMNRRGECRTFDQSSRFIQFPHEHDVLIGRAIRGNKHMGNISLRIFCWHARGAYGQSQREHKPSVIASVIRNVFDRTPPGRFLALDGDGLGFTDVPMSRIQTKIGSSLRERKWLPPLDAIELLGLQIKGPRSLIHCVAPSGKTAPFEAKERLVPLTPTISHQATVTLIDPNIVSQTRMAVFWPDDDVYYEGRVLDRMHNCVSLLYDDGESEWIDLSKHEYRVLGTTSPPPRSHPTNVFNASAISA